MAATTRARDGRGDGRVDVPVLLARWRTREIGLAHTFRECGGASPAEIEDLYDATAAALVEKDRAYESEEHLRAALHKGIRMRALRLHRDRRARTLALEQAAPAMHAAGRERAWREEPERALIAHEDDLIVGEFLAELTPLERRVFALLADGRSWRAIATALRLSEGQARNMTRACERKRERFLALYSTGRLCGYRSHTIGQLLSGEQSGELALAQALAHLRHCRTCQTEHHTSGAQLRSMFDARALALLPVPALPHTPAGLLDGLGELLARPVRAAQRLSAPQTGVRERVIEAAAGTGATAKIAVGVLGAVVLATGAVGATHTLGHRAHHHAPHTTVVAPVSVTPAAVVRHVPSYGPRHRPRRYTQRVPGGFAYLGVPTAPKRPQTPVVTQRGGGPFGP